ncbi:MAG: hypothetical protein A2X48_20695 [Lentisphaerae bacterium GWF2_49_21]|nr:MAG: hypothetical protein A2X48_20695 [Lentisphaerae bacterium GWF2_49_21]
MGREHWVETSLGNVGEIVTGNTPSKSNTAFYGKEYPWIKPDELDNEEFLFSSKEMLSSLGAKQARVLPKNSVLVSCIGNLGKIAISGKELATNQQINSIIFKDSIVDYKFGFHYIKTIKELLYQYASTTTLPIINKSKFSNIPFPLPPLNEQKRIVEKLDAILPKVKSAKARLDKIPSILKKFRQSVLSAACSGKLTEDWREGYPNLENGDTIYTRTKSFNKSTNIEYMENEFGWFTTKAENITSRITKGTTPKSGDIHANGPIPYLKVYNIVDQSINFHYKSQYVSKETHKGFLQRSIIYPGDVLMNIVGPPLGKVAITPDEFEEWNINQAIAYFRPIKELIISEYLYIVLCDGKPIQEISKEFRGSAGQQNISLEQSRNFLIPIPSLEEQYEIVRRVENLFALADSLESKYKKAMERVDKIEQSVLAKAFRGELVEPDPSDEPASELLKRIIEEKAKLMVGNKYRKKPLR